MPIIKSAKKRVKVAAKARTRNNKTKHNMRDALKAFTKALADGKAAEIKEAERQAVSAIDTAAKKAVIHKNKAARQKARLAAQVKTVGVKSPKQTIKKAPSKKAPTSKKAPAKTTKKASPKSK